MRSDIKVMNFPDDRPSGWPFETWMSPSEWERLNTSHCWSCFYILDTHLEFYFSKGIIRKGSLVFGFECDAQSPARIIGLGGVNYIGIDWRIFLQAMIIASHSIKNTSIDPVSVSHDADAEYIYEVLGKVLGALGGNEKVEVIRSAGALVHFIVSHELVHLMGGHIDWLNDELKTPEIVRSLEFVADYIAAFETIKVLMRPLIVDDGDVNELYSVSKLFGFTLVVYYLARVIPKDKSSKYPSLYERILVVLGRVLTSCRKGKNFADDGLQLVKSGIMDGVYDGLLNATEIGLIKRSENIAFLLKVGQCQRKNCVSCSDFARHVYSASLPLIKESLVHEEQLSRYSHNVHGFNKADFRLENLHLKQYDYCHFDSLVVRCVKRPAMRLFFILKRYL